VTLDAVDLINFVGAAGFGGIVASGIWARFAVFGIRGAKSRLEKVNSYISGGMVLAEKVLKNPNLPSELRRMMFLSLHSVANKEMGAWLTGILKKPAGSKDDEMSRTFAILRLEHPELASDFEEALAILFSVALPVSQMGEKPKEIVPNNLHSPAKNAETLSSNLPRHYGPAVPA
jgi:hypothetical protein